MGSPGQPPVQLVPTFSIPGADQSFVSDPVLLFTVPLGIPAQVSAVFLQVTADPDFPSFAGEQYALEIEAPGGPVQAQVWTPVLTTGEDVLGSATANLTWMIGGVGSDQQPFVTIFVAGSDDTAPGILAATVALPEITLQPNTTVSVIRGSEAEASFVTVTGVVTYTPNAGAVSTSDQITLTPLLLSQANG